MATTNITIRMDADIKKEADQLFSELGMNLTTAIHVFIRQSLREGKIPFEITLKEPNQETIKALLEAQKIARDSSVKGYQDIDALFKGLEA